MRAEECEYLVKCYGMMRAEGDIWICMERMDTSLDRFYKTAFDNKMIIPELLLARIAYSVSFAFQKYDFLGNNTATEVEKLKPLK